MTDIQTHQARPIVEELRELRDIARREHGLQARSTQRIQEALTAAEHHDDRRPPVGRKAGKAVP